MKKNHRPRGTHNRTQMPSAALQQKFLELASRFKAALAAQDHALGSQLAEQALKLIPGHMAVLSDYAFCLMRAGRHEEAHAVYLKIWHSPPAMQQQASATWLDGLTEVCGWLGDFAAVRNYGLCSLARADAQHGAAAGHPLSGPPAPFDARQPSRNVIAYSLFGANPRYCETMVKNADVARDLFPEWTCRVYLDDSVPQHVGARLRAAGADVIDIARTAHRDIHPLMWRFLVVDDPTVQRFLIRDADSLLSEREQAAVHEWQRSPYWFHHMRDYFTHTELLLAGMWGGCTGALQGVAESIRAFMARANDRGRFVDQHFLRECLWPTVRQSVLQHDDLFGFLEARPFPAHAPIRWNTEHFHVGSNVGHMGVGARSASRSDGELQRWALVTAQGERIGEYASVVAGGVWQSDFPFFLAEDIQAGRMTIELLAD